MSQSKTIAVGRFGDILNERPEGMSFKEYKQKLKERRKRLKVRLKGVRVWGTGMGSMGTATRDRIPNLIIK